ncbi:hypothetical protein EK21DRAFT_90809 [Setomelanomma holmii]|uniref:2EXR domain-containing protein n=1 Tax=Setomelanomma holmii TaxID=210430 RepID=A0A9P4H7U8_9PLEO|nr:hypothetical protein EK21DRAFT_90809 [Setomelanomma holmii]
MSAQLIFSVVNLAISDPEERPRFPLFANLAYDILDIIFQIYLNDWEDDNEVVRFQVRASPPHARRPHPVVVPRVPAMLHINQEFRATFKGVARRHSALYDLNTRTTMGVGLLYYNPGIQTLEIRIDDSLRSE